MRSANQAEMKILKTKSMPGSPKIALDLKYLTKQKSFISKVYEEWYFVTFTGATTSRFSCGNSENEFLPIINEYFAFPELKPV